MTAARASTSSPVAVPDSRLARQATDLIRSVESDLLYNDSLRVYALRVEHADGVRMRALSGAWPGTGAAALVIALHDRPSPILPWTPTGHVELAAAADRRQVPG
jgi:hypothetical protein